MPATGGKFEKRGNRGGAGSGVGESRNGGGEGPKTGV